MGVRYVQVSTSEWNIKNGYEIGTKVKHNGAMYISTRNVPVGINIGMKEYWKKLELAEDVSELADYVDEIASDVDDLIEDVGELDAKIDSLENVAEYSTTEKKIGKFNGKDLYRKLFVINATATQTLYQTGMGDIIDYIVGCGGYLIDERYSAVVLLNASTSFVLSGYYKADHSFEQITVHKGELDITVSQPKPITIYVWIDYVKVEV